MTRALMNFAAVCSIGAIGVGAIPIQHEENAWMGRDAQCKKHFSGLFSEAAAGDAFDATVKEYAEFGLGQLFGSGAQGLVAFLANAGNRQNFFSPAGEWETDTDLAGAFSDEERQELLKLRGQIAGGWTDFIQDKDFIDLEVNKKMSD